MARSALIPVALVMAMACGSAPPPHAEPPPPVPDNPVADLSWLAGSWSVEQEDTVVYEAWTVYAGGVMRGVNRTVGTDGIERHRELLCLAPRAGRAVYVASPSEQATTEFTATTVEDGRAVFENPEHDFPKRIEYVREGETLTARIEGDDEARSAEWRFERTGDPLEAGMAEGDCPPW